MPVVGDAAGGRPTGRRQIGILLQCPTRRRIRPSNTHVGDKVDDDQLRRDDDARDVNQTVGSSTGIIHRDELGSIRRASDGSPAPINVGIGVGASACKVGVDFSRRPVRARIRGGVNRTVENCRDEFGSIC